MNIKMSNSVAVQQKRFIRLTPSNNATEFSPTGAQPIIRFSVSDVQALAYLQDARLNFTFTADRVSNAYNAPPALTDDFNVDQCVSLSGVVDQIIVSSRRFGNTLEQVVNLGRLESSFYRSKMSPKMQASQQYNLNRSCGQGRFNRFSGQFSTGGALATATLNDYRCLMERKASLITSSKTCSIPFHSGTFLSDSPMDLSACGGLEIAVYLSKIEQLFFGVGNQPPTSASVYKLTNVNLTIPLLYKSADMIAQTPPEQVLEFLSWQSLYSILDSTTSSISYRLYLSGLVAGIHNMLPANQINSVSWNQYALKNPVVQLLTFLRDGQRSPMEKTAIVQENSTATNIDAATTYPEVVNDYMGAWSPVKEQVYSQVIAENLKGVNNRCGVFGMGCNFSPDSGGISMNGVLGVDVQSLIYDETTGNQTQYALYSFFLSRQGFLATPMGMKSL